MINKLPSLNSIFLSSDICRDTESVTQAEM